LGTDPNSAASKQVLSLVQENDGSLLIPILDLPQRSDASLTVEFSDDLTLWTAVDFEESERGLVVAASAQQGDKGFMRLAFSLNE